jgi:hypothetical protein
VSGADAKRGDIVRNLTTGRVGTVTGSSQFGRIIVAVSGGGEQKWERWDTEVLAQFEA